MQPRYRERDDDASEEEGHRRHAKQREDLQQAAQSRGLLRGRHRKFDRVGEAVREKQDDGRREEQRIPLQSVRRALRGYALGAHVDVDAACGEPEQRQRDGNEGKVIKHHRGKQPDHEDFEQHVGETDERDAHEASAVRTRLGVDAGRRSR